jgi:beta-lactamase class A
MSRSTYIRLSRIAARALLLLPLVALVGAAQPDSLQPRIERYLATKRATVGVGVKLLEGGPTFVIGDAHRYPMQSVYKFPLAVAVLQHVDSGALSLTQRVLLTPKDLRTRTWSPIRQKYPDGTGDLTLGDLLAYTVSQSDNNGCDVLFRMMKGTRETERRLLRMGYSDIRMRATEAEMARAWPVQYTNWTRPSAMLRLLEGAHRGSSLSASSTAFLLKLLTETSTGPKRIKGLLPAGTVVAHKTGSSGTNAKGVTAATNDVGIITLPDGRHVALAVFVSDSRETPDDNERIIAEIAKLVFDGLSEK